MMLGLFSEAGFRIKKCLDAEDSGNTICILYTYILHIVTFEKAWKNNTYNLELQNICMEMYI